MFKARHFLSVLFLFSSFFTQAQVNSLVGKWAGIVLYTQDNVPFEFEINDREGDLTLTIINGQERIEQKDVKVSGDSIFVRLAPFDVDLKAKWAKGTMTGKWIKNYRNSNGISFVAIKDGFRFKSTSRQPAKISQEFPITLKSENGLPYDGLALFNQQGTDVEGTIITGTGDLRYFAGIMDGDSLKMSSFDGAHAFLLKGSLKNNTWSGVLVFDNGYNEYWSATGEPASPLAEPFQSLNESDESKLIPFYDILAAGDGHAVFESAEFENKVTIVQILGSWCPNSLDETKYLTKWYSQNKDRGVQVLAVFYELNYSQEYGSKRIEDYVRDNSIPYKTALGGRANKGQAALAFPFINKIEAFPTLIILDKQGKARYIHNYFQGPATGERYELFDQQFNRIIDELVAE